MLYNLPVQKPAPPQMDEIAFLDDVLRAEANAIVGIADRLRIHDPERWAKAIDLLDQCRGHVVVAGMGKSGLVGAKISATFSSLGQPSNVLHPSEAVHGDLGRVRRGDMVMLLSYSGETEEVVNLASILRADGVPRIGLSQSDTSSLARLSDVHLALGDVAEACPLNLAPTASTTAMLALGDALALALSRRRGVKADDFHRHHPGGMLGVGLRPITEALRFKVGDNLAVVNDSVTVREALQQASDAAGEKRRTGAVMLVDASGRLSGIFTDGDLRRLFTNTNPGSVEHSPIKNVMTPRPQHLTVDDLVRDAVRLVRERRVDEIPVLDHDGKPVGLVDVQDLIAMKVVSE